MNAMVVEFDSLFGLLLCCYCEIMSWFIVILCVDITAEKTEQNIRRTGTSVRFFDYCYTDFYFCSVQENYLCTMHFNNGKKLWQLCSNCIQTSKS